MAYITNEGKKSEKKEDSKKPSKRGYRISGSIMSGKKFIQFTKEINAESKNEAVSKALEALKEQYRVATYQIMIKEISEGRAI